ncbi:MAG: hypothetical protein JSV42_11710 [Chloroflexota bacterium]|nr:MAG: hypothetical protein JSV42_11710 [Chloroflexota bacterium]
MEFDRAFLVICLTIAGVIALNVMIYLSLRRGSEVTTIDLMRKATKRAREPWKDEDDALKELADLVSTFKSNQVEGEYSDIGKHEDDE